MLFYNYRNDKVKIYNLHYCKATLYGYFIHRLFTPRFIKV